MEACGRPVPRNKTGFVQEGNNREPHGRLSDNSLTRCEMQQLTDSCLDVNCMPWSIQLRAVSAEEPGRLVQSLTGAIMGCGGWVLSRGSNDAGIVNLLFEFERHTCIEIYSLLMASGLELSQSGHIHFTELCQCTRNHEPECGTEIASVDLEIQTFPIETICLAPAPGIA
jgi:hypothetical protein